LFMPLYNLTQVFTKRLRLRNGLFKVQKNPSD
jgi:hypothetical protein